MCVVVVVDCSKKTNKFHLTQFSWPNWWESPINENVATMIIAICGGVDKSEMRVGILHHSVGIFISFQNSLKNFSKCD